MNSFLMKHFYNNNIKTYLKQPSPLHYCMLRPPVCRVRNKASNLSDTINPSLIDLCFVLPNQNRIWRVVQAKPNPFSLFLQISTKSQKHRNTRRFLRIEYIKFRITLSQLLKLWSSAVNKRINLVHYTEYGYS